MPMANRMCFYMAAWLAPTIGIRPRPNTELSSPQMLSTCRPSFNRPCPSSSERRPSSRRASRTRRAALEAFSKTLLSRSSCLNWTRRSHHPFSRLCKVGFCVWSCIESEADPRPRRLSTRPGRIWDEQATNEGEPGDLTTVLTIVFGPSDEPNP